MKGKQKILVAMSGGVDSSVAAAVLLEQGYEVVGVTMKLWGGTSDTGCCSVSDVIDARRVADQLGIQHHVFNFGDEFDAHVVDPYVEAHKAGATPNPCLPSCSKEFQFIKLQCISCCIELARRRAHPNPAPQYSDTFQNMPIPEFTLMRINAPPHLMHASCQKKCLEQKEIFKTLLAR